MHCNKPADAGTVAATTTPRTRPLRDRDAYLDWMKNGSAHNKHRLWQFHSLRVCCAARCTCIHSFVYTVFFFSFPAPKREQPQSSFVSTSLAKSACTAHIEYVFAFCLLATANASTIALKPSQDACVFHIFNTEYK